MTDMLDAPASRSPSSERRREIAAILARSMLRLCQCHENTHDSRPSWTAEKALESAQDRLDDGAKTSPLMCPLVNDRETMKEFES